MSTNLILVSIIFSILIITLILYYLKKDKLKVKYSIIWLILFILLLVCLLIPNLLNIITKVLGFQTASNMVLSLFIGILIIINISLTGIVSSQDKKIRLLIQEVSVIKKKQ